MTDTPHAPQRPKHIVIVGGGISGLSTAWFLSEQARETGTLAEITLLEAQDHPGGILGTDLEDGFLFEHAADQFLATPAALGLVRALGIADDLITPRRVQPAIKVWARGALRDFPAGMPLAVPSRLLPFLRSDLLSWKGKWRVLAEALMLPETAPPDDESMQAFFTRRLGQELADAVVGPVLAGIYSGDPDNLSIQATFPRFPAMLKAEGSLLLAALKQPSPAASFRSFRKGMGTLPGALYKALQRRPEITFRFQSRVSMIGKPSRQSPQFTVQLEGDERISADALVVALPTAHAAPLLNEHFADIAWHLQGFESTSSGGVYLAYRRDDAPQIPKNIGILMPRDPAWTIRGISIATNKFEGRAPDGFHLLRIFIGGEGHTNIIDQDDAEITHKIRNELNILLGLRAEPVLQRVRRYRQQTPQYRVGHLTQVAHLMKRLPQNLRLVGNAYCGVGVPACIKMAQDTAQQLIHKAGK